MHNVKFLARHLAIKLAPVSGEVLSAYRAKRDGWVRLPSEIEALRKNSGLGDLYVFAYEHETRIYSCLCRAMFPENTAAQVKQADLEFNQMPPSEQIVHLDEITDKSLNSLDRVFEMTADETTSVLESLESLPECERIASLDRIQNMLAFSYAYFYNILSLMVHGQKLTTLVPLALQGDKEAFAKAIQIDRNLLTVHPYFKDTYARLQTGEDVDFLDVVLYRVGNPTLRGKIKYPALFSLFAVLDSFGLLDDFTASEILDMCDEAKLDRFQNRIDDETNLNKRRAEYRRYQILPK